MQAQPLIGFHQAFENAGAVGLAGQRHLQILAGVHKIAESEVGVAKSVPYLGQARHPVPRQEMQDLLQLGRGAGLVVARERKARQRFPRAGVVRIQTGQLLVGALRIRRIAEHLCQLRTAQGKLVRSDNRSRVGQRGQARIGLARPVPVLCAKGQVGLRRQSTSMVGLQRERLTEQDPGLFNLAPPGQKARLQGELAGASLRSTVESARARQLHLG